MVQRVGREKYRRVGTDGSEGRKREVLKGRYRWFRG